MSAAYEELDSVLVYLDPDRPASDGGRVEQGQEGSVVWVSPDGRDLIVEIWRTNTELVGDLEFTTVSCKASELRRVDSCPTDS